MSVSKLEANNVTFIDQDVTPQPRCKVNKKIWILQVSNF